jgi:hypothetical protein
MIARSATLPPTAPPITAPEGELEFVGADVELAVILAVGFAVGEEIVDESSEPRNIRVDPVDP